MIGVTYLGNNPETQERLKYIPGRLVQFATNYKEAANMCSPHVQNEHFILFFEQSVQAEDVTAITYLKKKLKNVYIILLTHQLDQEDRKNYQKCGINDTLDANASITEINKKIQFIADREGMLFDDAPSKHRILRFKIPFWKRLFDVVFSLIAIIILSPVFIITAIAIRLESKGPVIFKSKRVGQIEGGGKNCRQPICRKRQEARRRTAAECHHGPTWCGGRDDDDGYGHGV